MFEHGLLPLYIYDSSLRHTPPPTITIDTSRYITIMYVMLAAPQGKILITPLTTKQFYL